nr:MAG TPA_asm: hypothetical protein [Caudoviricetes sp.]
MTDKIYIFIYQGLCFISLLSAICLSSLPRQHPRMCARIFSSCSGFALSAVPEYRQRNALKTRLSR